MVIGLIAEEPVARVLAIDEPIDPIHVVGHTDARVRRRQRGSA
jgi:hypothetical protein